MPHISPARFAGSCCCVCSGSRTSHGRSIQISIFALSVSGSCLGNWPCTGVQQCSPASAQQPSATHETHTRPATAHPATMVSAASVTQPPDCSAHARIVDKPPLQAAAPAAHRSHNCTTSDMLHPATNRCSCLHPAVQPEQHAHIRHGLKKKPDPSEYGKPHSAATHTGLNPV